MTSLLYCSFLIGYYLAQSQSFVFTIYTTKITGKITLQLYSAAFSTRKKKQPHSLTMFNYLPEQAIACFLLYLLTNIQTTSSNQPAVATKDGVFFNLHQKILLTEKFVKTEILVPYPVYNKTVESKLTNLTRAHSIIPT